MKKGLILLMVAAVANVARAQDDSESNHSLRLGADVGGAYTSNVYGNASQLKDLLGLAGVSIDGDLMPSSDVILKLDYRGELELYRDLTTESNYGHNLGLSAGVRPTDSVYLQATAGGEHAWFPRRREYTFWGVFGRGMVRWEVGDASTLEAGYRVRGDQFPTYDLDNVTHRGDVTWATAVGDYVEIEVPAAYEASFYSERYVLDVNGNATGDKRFTQYIEAEPSLMIAPTFDLEIDVRLAGELNISDDTYYSDGPFGVTDPAVDPELIRHFDSFWGARLFTEVRWLVQDDLLVHGEAGLGFRGFSDRPAYDADGVNTGEREQDLYVSAALELEYRFADVLSVALVYGFFRQFSNDALWDYHRHRVGLTIGTWWES